MTEKISDCHLLKILPSLLSITVCRSTCRSFPYRVCYQTIACDVLTDISIYNWYNISPFIKQLLIQYSSFLLHLKEEN